MKRFLKIEGKIVGDYNDTTKVYTKRVRRDKHRLWKYDAYGIQTTILTHLKEIGCLGIVITELDTHTVYVSQFHQWIQSSLAEDLGHGMQKFLPVGEMKKLFDVGYQDK